MRAAFVRITRGALIGALTGAWSTFWLTLAAGEPFGLFAQFLPLPALDAHMTLLRDVALGTAAGVLFVILNLAFRVDVAGESRAALMWSVRVMRRYAWFVIVLAALPALMLLQRNLISVIAALIAVIMLVVALFSVLPLDVLNADADQIQLRPRWTGWMPLWTALLVGGAFSLANDVIMQLLSWLHLETAPLLGLSSTITLAFQIAFIAAAVRSLRASPALNFSKFVGACIALHVRLWVLGALVIAPLQLIRLGDDAHLSVLRLPSTGIPVLALLFLLGAGRLAARSMQPYNAVIAQPATAQATA